MAQILPSIASRLRAAGELIKRDFRPVGRVDIRTDYPLDAVFQKRLGPLFNTKSPFEEAFDVDGNRYVTARIDSCIGNVGGMFRNVSSVVKGKPMRQRVVDKSIDESVSPAIVKIALESR